MLDSNMPGRLLALAYGLAIMGSARGHCTLRAIDHTSGEFRAGAQTVHLGEANNPDAPNAWLGPLRTTTCTFDLSIIETPFAPSDSRYLYVPTYSGSNRHVTLIDLNSCTTIWTSKAFSGVLAFKARRLQLGEQRIPLDASCLPRHGRSSRHSQSQSVR